jgi:hypothetical protein
LRDRRGFTAVEALVALLLSLLLFQAAWSSTRGAAHAAVGLVDRAEALAGSRALAWILGEELAGARAGIDVARPVADSFALRAFRGAALPCAREPDGAWIVRYRGLRQPQPDQDSVLALAADGTWRALAITQRGAAVGRCPPGDGSEERWRLAPPPAGVALLRVYERGSYHLTDDVLRYRTGAGGRQPLTAAVFEREASGFDAAHPGGIRVRARTQGTHRAVTGVAWDRTYAVTGAW